MTSKEHKQVIQLHNAGWSYKQIADRFGVNKNSVSSIIKKYKEKKGLL